MATLTQSLFHFHSIMASLVTRGFSDHWRLCVWGVIRFEIAIIGQSGKPTSRQCESKSLNSIVMQLLPLVHITLIRM